MKEREFRNIMSMLNDTRVILKCLIIPSILQCNEWQFETIDDDNQIKKNWSYLK